MAAQSTNTGTCSCENEKFVMRDGMRFLRTSAGLVFHPEFNPHNRKHACPDCATCAFCADSRCAACLGQAAK